MTRWSDTTGATAMRVGAQLLRDRIANPKVTERGQVPGSVEAITPAWWTAVLCKDSGRRGRIVLRVRLQGHASPSSLRPDLQRRGQRAGLPTGVFTKSLPTLVTRMIGGYNGRRGPRAASTCRSARTRDRGAARLSRGLRPATLAGVNVIEDLVVTKARPFCNHKTIVTRPWPKK